MIFPYQGDFFHIFHDFPDFSLMVGSLVIVFIFEENVNIVLKDHIAAGDVQCWGSKQSNVIYT